MLNFDDLRCHLDDPRFVNLIVVESCTLRNILTIRAYIFTIFTIDGMRLSQSCLNNWSKVVFNERVDPGVSFTFLKSSFTEHHNIFHNFNILFVLRYTSFVLTELVY